MKPREYKYLKADRWFYFFGEKITAPNHHLRLRRRIDKMMTAQQYMEWKRKQ